MFYAKIAYLKFFSECEIKHMLLLAVIQDLVHATVKER